MVEGCGGEWQGNDGGIKVIEAQFYMVDCRTYVNLVEKMISVFIMFQVKQMNSREKNECR